MTITKKHILYGAITLVVAAALAVAGASLLRTFKQIDDSAVSNNKDSTNAQPQSITEEEAAVAIDSAKKALAAGKYDDATDLYQKARAYYETTKNTEKKAEIDAALSLLAAQKEHAPAIIKAPIAGQE